ncbi:Xylosyltransferase 1, partial [Physocladia obscura]
VPSFECDNWRQRLNKEQDHGEEWAITHSINNNSNDKQHENSHERGEATATTGGGTTAHSVSVCGHQNNYNRPHAQHKQTERYQQQIDNKSADQEQRPPSRFFTAYTISPYNRLHRHNNISIVNSNISIAYAFLVHSQDSIDSLQESIGLLYSEKDVFFIHADSTTTPKKTLETLSKTYARFTNIRILNASVSLTSSWGSIDLLHAEIALLREALWFDAVKWDVFLLLDGAAFPLQRSQTIRNALDPVVADKQAVLAGAFDAQRWKQVEGKNVLEHCTETFESKKSKSCASHAWKGGKGFNRAGKAKTPDNKPVYKGSQWIVLSRPAAEFSMRDDMMLPWLKFFSGSFAPDEMFFQSILANVHWSIAEDFRYLVKIHSKKGCESYEPVRKLGFSPCTLGLADWKDIRQAQNDGFLFARKFFGRDPVKDKI